MEKGQAYMTGQHFSQLSFLSLPPDNQRKCHLEQHSQLSLLVLESKVKMEPFTCDDSEKLFTLIFGGK